VFFCPDKAAQRKIRSIKQADFADNQPVRLIKCFVYPACILSCFTFDLIKRPTLAPAGGRCLARWRTGAASWL